MPESLIDVLDDVPAETPAARSAAPPARSSSEIAAAARSVSAETLKKLTKGQRKALVESFEYACNDSYGCSFSDSKFVALRSTTPTSKVLIRNGLARGVDEHRVLYPEDQHVRFNSNRHGVLTPLGEEIAYTLLAEELNSEANLARRREGRDSRIAKIAQSRSERAEELSNRRSQLDQMEKILAGCELPAPYRMFPGREQKNFLTQMRDEIESAVESNGHLDPHHGFFLSQLHPLFTHAYEAGQRDALEGAQRL